MGADLASKYVFMPQGIIKDVDFKKGLGYVLNGDGREIVLVTKGLEDKIEVGRPITFEILHTRRGIIAVKIQPVLDQA